MMRTCADCHYFDSIDDSERGVCRVLPPVPQALLMPVMGKAAPGFEVKVVCIEPEVSGYRLACHNFLTVLKGRQ